MDNITLIEQATHYQSAIIDCLIEIDTIIELTKNKLTMKEIIEKYEAKLNYLNKSVEETSHLMDKYTLDMMNSVKILLTDVITDLRSISALIKESNIG